MPKQLQPASPHAHTAPASSPTCPHSSSQLAHMPTQLKPARPHAHTAPASSPTRPHSSSQLAHMPTHLKPARHMLTPQESCKHQQGLTGGLLFCASHPVNTLGIRLRLLDSPAIACTKVLVIDASLEVGALPHASNLRPDLAAFGQHGFGLPFQHHTVKSMESPAATTWVAWFTRPGPLPSVSSPHAPLARA